MTCSRLDVHAADVVQAAVVGLADHGVDRRTASFPGCASVYAMTRLHGRADIQRIREDDRASRSCRVPPPASTRRACRTRCRRTRRPATLSWKRLPRRARSPSRRCGRVALDERDVPDAHAGDIGDGIQRTGSENAGRQPEIARPRTAGLSAELGLARAAGQRKRFTPCILPQEHSVAAWPRLLPVVRLPGDPSSARRAVRLSTESPLRNPLRDRDTTRAPPGFDIPVDGLEQSGSPGDKRSRERSSVRRRIGVIRIWAVDGNSRRG